MFRNNLKLALRQLWHNRFYAGISISGLALSMACCLLMLLYLQDEWSYDQHNRRPGRIYRLVFENYLGEGKFATTPLPIGPAFGEDIPEAEAVTRVARGLKTLVRYEDKKFLRPWHLWIPAFHRSSPPTSCKVTRKPRWIDPIRS